MPSIKPNVTAAQTFRNMANNVDKLSEGANKTIGNTLAEIVKAPFNHSKEVAMIVGGGYVAKEGVEGLLATFRGEDVAFDMLHPGTSGTDAIAGTALFTALTIGGVGLTAKGAFELAANIAEGMEKS